MEVARDVQGRCHKGPLTAKTVGRKWTLSVQNCQHNDTHQPVGAVDIPCSLGPSPTRLYVIVMPSCEKCWRDAHGDPVEYAVLVEQRNCTPEEQAGVDAEWCKFCTRKTIHMFSKVCMVPDCEGVRSPHDKA